MKTKIQPDNFVAFFTVCGFFLGLTFSVVSIEGAFEIIVFTILITFLFYMMIHISITVFINKESAISRIFDKEGCEMINDILITDLEKKEEKSRRIMDAIAEEKIELQKMEAKEKRRKNGKKDAA